MENKDLIEDEIYIGYVSQSSNQMYIFTAYNGGGYKNFIIDNTYYEDNTRGYNWSKLRNATEEEKRHLKACISKGEFVPQPKHEIINDFQIY